MFKEFNVEFQDVEMIGGADNLLENTKVTKVVMSGDNKMSSLDSAFKNCSDLDNIQGGLDLNGVNDIDNILEGNSLIKSIYLKNINNENISVNNSFPNVEEINISGELYNKKAIQNTIASKEWTFDNFNYTDTVGDNVITKEADVIEDNQITIKDTLEQKAKGIEIVGQTYENLSKGKGEYNLTDTYSATWTESNNSIENPPSMIEIPEIFGNTIQDENDLNIIQSVGDLYVDEEGTPILDEDGNEQYKLEIESGNDLIRDFRNYDYSLKRLWNGILENHIVKSANVFKNEVQFQMNGNIQGVSILGVKANVLGVYTIRFKYNSFDYSPFIRMNSMKKGVFVEQPKTTIKTDEEGYRYAEFSLSKEFDELRFTLGIESCFDASFTHSFSDVVIYLGTGLKINPQSNKTTILMPQPLRKVAGISDKLYWDNVKGKYIIEKNIMKYTYNNSDHIIGFGPGSNATRIRVQAPNVTKKYDKNYCIAYGYLRPSYYSNSLVDLAGAKYLNAGLGWLDVSLGHNYSTDTRGYLTNNPFTCYYVMNEPQIVETKILEKLSLETYLPKTYISTNTEVQPNQMTINNKKTLINLKELSNNTGYTIQFKCNEKSDNPIKFNLCGTEKEVNMPIGVNHVSITTSNNLTNNQLELSGAGNIVSEVMVVEGEMNQYPTYFDGVQNAGVLEDGKYKIDIKTNEGFVITIKAIKPLVKGDKLYWNKSNKRYEIDRSGEIEIPTVEGNVMDLPRLYQREDTNLTVESGNIKPGEVKIEYLDIN